MYCACILISNQPPPKRTEEGLSEDWLLERGNERFVLNYFWNPNPTKIENENLIFGILKETLAHFKNLNDKYIYSVQNQSQIPTSFIANCLLFSRTAKLHSSSRCFKSHTIGKLLHFYLFSLSDMSTGKIPKRLFIFKRVSIPFASPAFVNAIVIPADYFHKFTIHNFPDSKFNLRLNG